MPTIEIQGRRVQVGDGFMRLTPEQQQQTVNEIASSFSPNASSGGQRPPMQAQAGMGWGDVPGQMVENFIPSAKQFGKDLAQPFLHPIETYEGMRDIGKGALQHAGIMEGGSELQPTPEQQKASAVKQFFVDRYGSIPAIKNTLGTDPVGALSDASTVLTGGGTLAAKVPMTAAKAAGAAAKTVGRAVDPLSAVTRPIGPMTRHVVGTTMGTGSDALKVASEAGKANGPRGKALREGMRNDTVDVTLREAKTALAEMREEKHALYLQNIAATGANQTPIQMAPIVQRFSNLDDSFQRKGHYTLDKRGRDTLNSVGDVLSEWYNDPALQNAMDFDGLKRRIEALRPENPTDQQNRIITVMTRAVKDQIEVEVPSYKKAMVDYEKMSAVETEIEKTLSLGRNENPDKAIRKLISSMRNNVNTNYGRRKKLIDLLDEKRPGLKEALAGAMLNSIAPRGLGKLYASGLVGGGLFTMNPAVIPPILMTSPRLMGEGAYYSGKFGPRVNELAAPLAFQSGRAADENLGHRNRGQY